VSGMRDRKVELTELVPGDERLVTHQEVIREASEDESQTTEVSVNRFVTHWCGHYKPYGFSCHCGKRFCRSCLEAGRIWYCEECGATLGACCYRKRHDGKVLCPEHWQWLDWQHPAFRVLWAACFLAGLGLALYLINLVVE